MARFRRLLGPLALAIPVALALLLPPALSQDAADAVDPDGAAVAYFAAGCFWCVEHDFEKQAGVLEAISGYMGGDLPDPTYEQVSTNTTGHREAVQVRYDPSRISYQDLLGVFWRMHDPTDAGGSFVDRGESYTSAIFPLNDAQQRLAEGSRAALAASGKFRAPIATAIEPAGPFYRAEDYHQDYAQRNPLRYNFYRFNSGRDQFIGRVWQGDDTVYQLPDAAPGEEGTEDTEDTEGAEGFRPGGPATIAATPTAASAPVAPGAPSFAGFQKPSDAELRARLSDLQYRVTQLDATERPFDNAYWDNHADGVYVDVVSGEPLFSSRDKFESGTGWPSFTRPLEPANIVERPDRKLFVVRTEVRSRHADSHLGHVFDDGPAPTGLRYCINSAALRFVPVAELEAEGLGHYLPLFETARAAPAAPAGRAVQTTN